MTWQCREPGHQHPLYWPSCPRIFQLQHQNVFLTVIPLFTKRILSFRTQYLTQANMCWLRKTHNVSWDLGPVSIYGMGILMLKIRRSQDCLIFNMVIPILVRRHLYTETVPWFIEGSAKIFSKTLNMEQSSLSKTWYLNFMVSTICCTKNCVWSWCQTCCCWSH